MAIKVTSKFNSKSLENIKDTIRNWIETSQESLDNEESRDYPNDDRVEKLQNRIDSLQSALDSLGEIE